MSEKDWERLFELIGEVANMPAMSAGEKAAILKQKAEEYGVTTDLGEFASYAADE